MNYGSWKRAVTVIHGKACVRFESAVRDSQGPQETESLILIPTYSYLAMCEKPLHIRVFFFTPVSVSVSRLSVSRYIKDLIVTVAWYHVDSLLRLAGRGTIRWT